jgi:hypothetical protein
MSPYEEGLLMGAYRAAHGDYDPRWDFVDHSKAGTLDEFKRGFMEGFDKARKEQENES